MMHSAPLTLVALNQIERNQVDLLIGSHKTPCLQFDTSHVGDTMKHVEEGVLDYLKSTFNVLAYNENAIKAKTAHHSENTIYTVKHGGGSIILYFFHFLDAFLQH
ncbi:hypothetical protein GOODEAATRI_016005 [Goodea atripinnis]|uniref:Uncharacterized protein n=1 Tax=Goodea atripinnis TaxID=208336 RepID=A0ABV0MI62_9TELE